MSKLEELVSVASALPSDAIAELIERAEEMARHPAALTPIALGGLWAGIEITDEDLREARHEMWKRFEEDGP